MSYQIHVKYSNGRSYVGAILDNLPEARKQLASMIEASSTPNLLIKETEWRSIELYRVELISSTPVSSGEDLE